MAKLSTCNRCGGFVPLSASRCPNCNRRSLARRLLNLAGGGAVAMTLMACYGMAPHMREPPKPQPCGPTGDRDGDGSCAPADCNDDDAKVSPTANDPKGDGIDQNCDGVDGVASAANTPDPSVPDPSVQTMAQ